MNRTGIFAAGMVLWAGTPELLGQDPVQVKTNDDLSTPQVRLSFTGRSATTDIYVQKARLRFDGGSVGYFNLSGAGSSTAAGDLWYSGGVLRYYDGAERVVVNRDAAETLTNKTMGSGSIWNGTAIGIAYGGTNAISFTSNQFVWYDGSKLAASTYSQSSFIQRNMQDTSSASVGGGGYVLSITNTSTGDPTRGFQGSVSSVGAEGVFNGVTGTSARWDTSSQGSACTNYGVEGTASGSPTAGSNNNIGVYGNANGSAANSSVYCTGVYGLANGTNGANNTGVEGNASSDGGRGVYGHVNESGTGTYTGCYGWASTSSTGAGTVRGLYAEADASGAGNTVTLYALYGDSTATGTGSGSVYGIYSTAVAATGGNTKSVYGLSVTAQGGGTLNLAGQFLSVDPSTSTLVDVMELQRQTSGTALNNLGGGILFKIEDSNNEQEQAARIGALLTNAATGSETSALVFQTRTSGGALLERVRIAGDGAISGTGSAVTHVSFITDSTSNGSRAIYGKQSATTTKTAWISGGVFAGAAGVYGEAGSSGSEYHAGVFGYDLGSGNNSGGVVGAYTNTNFGGLGFKDGTGTVYAGYFAGDVKITGNLTKGGGSFLIDHPDDPWNKTLRHYFVESPESLCIYRGVVDLNDEGVGEFALPGYFPGLTKEDQASAVLTSVGRPFEVGYEWNKDFTRLRVFGAPGRRVSYIVLADRDDPTMRAMRKPTEREKGPGADCEKGKLLYPKAYETQGEPATNPVRKE